MEIRAFKNGKEVKIDPTHPISVDMKVYKMDDGFKFWYLEEDKKAWSAHQANYSKAAVKSSAVEIEKCQAKIQNIDEALIPVQIQIEVVDKKPIEGESLVPSASAKKMVIAFDEKYFPELAGLKDVEFEYLEYSESLSQQLKATTWNKVDLKKSNDYYAEFSNRKSKVTVKVKPVLSGAELSKLQSKLALAKIEKQNKLKLLREEKKQLMASKGVLEKRMNMLRLNLLEKQTAMIDGATSSNRATQRSQANNVLALGTASFETRRFGVFNSDKPVKYPAVFAIPVVLLDRLGRKIKASRAFVLDHKKDVRYSFSLAGENGFRELAWNNNRSSVVVIDVEGKNVFSKPSRPVAA